MKSGVLVTAVVLAVASGGSAWWLLGRTRTLSAVSAPSGPAPAPSASPASSVHDPGKLYLSTTGELNERVRRVFPNGVASEDARARIGTAPPPPDDDAPDGSQSFVSTIVPAAPITVAEARAALPASDAERIERSVKGRVSSGPWLDVGDPPADGATFSRLAVIVDLMDLDTPVDAPRLEREEQWARAFAARLHAPLPTFSMSPKQAAARARDAMVARQKYSAEDVDIGVVIAAPKGRRFQARNVWDAVYSAGFIWGDGDYFHWLPSETTDESQGISMGTSTGTSYFLPESVLANDGRADVVDLEMSFNAARCWQPTQVFDVMSRAADYLAQRLGGTVTTKLGAAFDSRAERARVVAIERELTAHGITPGTELALQTF